MSTPKTEETKPATPTAQPVAATSTTNTPAPASSTFTWPAAGTTPTTTIPYQPYQGYSSHHYPQAAYGHYQYPAPLTTQAIQAQLSRSALTTTPVPNTTSMAAAGTTFAANADNVDVTTLNDALGSAGVDLKAEEESLQRSHDQHQPYRPYEDRTRKQALKPAFDTVHLGTKMRTIGTSHKVTRIPDDAVNYVALALRARLQDLITNMISASHHRTDTQFDRPASLYSDDTPMWKISLRSDVAKQLAVLEKVEREEEMKVRRERKERAEMTAAHAAVLAAQANGAAAAGGVGGDIGGANGGAIEEEGGVKKKRKKDGPGVTARNMSEDVRKKMSNAVATQAAGLGGKYAWMNAANANTPAPKPKPAPVVPIMSPTSTATPIATTATATTTTTTTTTGGATSMVISSATATTSAATSGTVTSSWARPYVPTKKSTSAAPAQATAEEDTRTTVTMRDAIFVVEKERGHGGGRGAARGFI